MANRILYVWNSTTGEADLRNSNAETMDFVMLNVSTDPSADTHVVRRGWANSTYAVVGHNHSGTYIPVSEKGANSGVATLDSAGKVPVAQLPASTMLFMGVWNATTNVPKLNDDAKARKVIQDITYAAKATGHDGNLITIIYTDTVTQGNEVASAVGNVITVEIEDGVSTATQVKAAIDTFNSLVDATITGTAGNAQAAFSPAVYLAGGANTGDIYRVGTAGTQDLGSGSLSYVVGDQVMYSAATNTWEKSHSGADIVQSVNTQTGAVVLATDHISDSGQTNKYYTATAARSDLIAASISDGDTTHAPDGNSVFDALAGKAAVSHSHATSDITGFDAGALAAAVQSGAITDGVTKAPTHDAVYDALALKKDILSATETVTNDNAGAITVGKVAYVKATGNVDLAKADAIATCGNIVFVYDASIAGGGTGKVLVAPGEEVPGISGLTPNLRYFVDPSTAGSITSTPPSTVGHVVKQVGKATPGGKLRFLPGDSMVIMA